MIISVPNAETSWRNFQIPNSKILLKNYQNHKKTQYMTQLGIILCLN